MPQQSHRNNSDADAPPSYRERAESSCSSGYGSSVEGRNNHHHDQPHKSPQRNNNSNRNQNQNRHAGGGHHYQHQQQHCTFPDMTLLCHRVDLFDDFVPSKADCNNYSAERLVPVRCLTLEGGCACRTPCSFCHTLVEHECPDAEVPADVEAPPGVHPGFAFLFAGKKTSHGDNTMGGTKSNDSAEAVTTISSNLVIDQIFAQNHGLLVESGDGAGVAVKKYHHPPVGKFRFTPPLLELSDFFSDMGLAPNIDGNVQNGNHGNRSNEIGAENNDNRGNSGNGSNEIGAENNDNLASFFDDFAFTPPQPSNQYNDAQRHGQSRNKNKSNESNKKVLVYRTPLKTVKKAITTNNNNSGASGKCFCQCRYESLKKGSSQPNPHDPSVVHDKYWAQRKRLFKKFDEGIQLDGEGWYSVTPEVVADHVATRFADAACQLTRFSPPANSQNTKKGILSMGGTGSGDKAMVILDAFCGCGGNAIAFAKLPSTVVSHIICVDVDRTKLRKAAHNASIYNIPPNRIVFIEANSVAVMERCYRNGILVMDPPPRTAAGLSAYPPREIYDDFTIGGIDLLAEFAQHIDAIFMDPPWGGMDYGAMGKDGYDLARDMKIRGCKRGCVGFPPTAEVDGVRLLKIAAAATSTRFVVYDLPRNANKRSLAVAALEAGYEGNSKLEEHYLNGRLKTVTAYFGQDFRHLLDLKRN